MLFATRKYAHCIFMVAVGVTLALEASHIRQFDRSFTSFMVHLVVSSGRKKHREKVPDMPEKSRLLLSLEESLMVRNLLVEQLEELDVEESHDNTDDNDDTYDEETDYENDL